MKDIDPITAQRLFADDASSSKDSQMSSAHIPPPSRVVVGTPKTAAGLKRHFNDIIQMANPEHSAIIKTFHGKGTAKDYLGELDEFLNESDEDDDEDEEEKDDEEDDVIKRLD